MMTRVLEAFGAGLTGAGRPTLFLMLLLPTVAAGLVTSTAAATAGMVDRGADARLVLAAEPRDQIEAFDARRTGRILPLREIEGRIIPTMHGAQYLGFDFDSSDGIYTLKFLRDGNVIWIEVDGRSGAILARTGK